MAVDPLSTFTNFINSPPGVLVAGGVLAGIVWKFFDKVEDKLNDDTKLEIAVWLLGVKPIGPKMEPWPDTFAKVFDRVFGTKHLSWKCFWRSCIASYSVFLIAPLWGAMFVPGFRKTLWSFFAVGWITNALPDYISLLETRFVLSIMRKTQNLILRLLLLVCDLILTVAVESGIIVIGYNSLVLLAAHHHGYSLDTMPYNVWPLTTLVEEPSLRLFFLYPCLFTSVWLWLYAGSGFLLKFARRFDVGFQWFNRRFDIEKKPLSSIGLVAGCIVALVYWAAVVVSRVV